MTSPRAMTMAGCFASLLTVSLPSQALPITLDTAWMDASAKMVLSPDAKSTLALTSITMAASGGAYALGGGSYSIPVTQLTADIGLLPPSLTPMSSRAATTTLSFHNQLSGGDASFSNLNLDFTSGTILADVLLPNQRIKAQQSVFSFDVIKPLSFSLTGGVSVNLSLGNLRLTDSGANSFADGLKLPSYLSPLFTQINFGTIEATIRPWFRPAAPKAPSVPEPSTWLLMGLGLTALQAARRPKSVAL